MGQTCGCFMCISQSGPEWGLPVPVWQQFRWTQESGQPQQGIPRQNHMEHLGMCQLFTPICFHLITLHFIYILISKKRHLSEIQLYSILFTECVSFVLFDSNIVCNKCVFLLIKDDQPRAFPLHSSSRSTCSMDSPTSQNKREAGITLAATFTANNRWAASLSVSLSLLHTHSVVYKEQEQTKHQPRDYLDCSALDFYLHLMFHTCWSWKLILPSGIPPTHRDFSIQEFFFEFNKVIGSISYCHILRGSVWKMVAVAFEIFHICRHISCWRVLWYFLSFPRSNKGAVGNSVTTILHNNYSEKPLTPKSSNQKPSFKYVPNNCLPDLVLWILMTQNLEIS